MADEEDVPSGLDQPFGAPVHLGHERAGRVDKGEAAVPCLGRHRLRHAVRGEDHRPVVRHFAELVDEDRTHLLEAVDDESVVDDFVPHVDRRPEPLQCELDDLDRPVDARAKAARRGNEDVEGRPVQHGDSHVSLRLQP